MWIVQEFLWYLRVRWCVVVQNNTDWRTATIAPMNPMGIVLGPSLVGVGMTNTMRANALRYLGIGAVVLGPVAHVVVAGVMHAAGSALTQGGIMRDKYLVGLMWFPVSCFHFASWCQR